MPSKRSSYWFAASLTWSVAGLFTLVLVGCDEGGNPDLADPRGPDWGKKGKGEGKGSKKGKGKNHGKAQVVDPNKKVNKGTANVTADIKPPVETDLPTLGLANLYTNKQRPTWPVEISAKPKSPEECTGRCELWTKVEKSLAEAAAWMGKVPKARLRVESAIALTEVRKTVDTPEFRELHAAAIAASDREGDLPEKRFWDPSARSAPEATSKYFLPGPGEKRVNDLRVLVEAIHCKENGWRSDATLYAAGAMRDRGGKHSANSLRALTLAHKNGCIAEAAYNTVAQKVKDELRDAQPATLQPKASSDITVYALRMVALIRADESSKELDVWATTLVTIQNSDGSWTMSTGREPKYDAFEATLTGAWALSEWVRLRLGANKEEPEDN